MEAHPILIERRAGYHVITLNRPQRLNAFNEAMHRALRHALAEAEDDADCRALLLTGAGRGFCAGQDLNDRLANSGETQCSAARSKPITTRSSASCARCRFR
jgi:2-(1,2-epoxy-1,2-dihydrophenyl)acetyl-CoA isomerase